MEFLLKQKRITKDNELVSNAEKNKALDKIAENDLADWSILGPNEYIVNLVKDSDTERIQPNIEGIIALSRDLETAFQNGDFCDVEVKVQDCVFQAHKIILSARSPVFTSMLQHDMKEKNSSRIEIMDCDPHIFKDFLYYVYCGKFEKISHENVVGLYKVADKYDVKELKAECFRFMKDKLDEDLFCSVMVLVLEYDEKDLMNKAIDFFIANAPKILVTVKWQKFLIKHPVYANELYIKAINHYIEKKT